MADNVTLILTSAGVAAMVQADNTGTEKITIHKVAFGTGKYTPSASQTELQESVVETTTVAGKNVGDNVIHVEAVDQSSLAYNVTEVGIFAKKSDGTELLFAVYSHPTADPILQKTATSMVALSIDLLISQSGIDSITFENFEFINPPATTTVAGVAYLATEEEVEKGLDGAKIVTPATLQRKLNNLNLASVQSVSTLPDASELDDNTFYIVSE